MRKNGKSERTLVSREMLNSAWSLDMTRESNHALSLAGVRFLSPRFEQRPISIDGSDVERVNERTRATSASKLTGDSTTDTRKSQKGQQEYREGRPSNGQGLRGTHLAHPTC